MSIDFLVPQTTTRTAPKNACPITVISEKDWGAFARKTPKALLRTLGAQKLTGKAGEIALHHDSDGELAGVYAVVSNTPGFYALAPVADFLSARLPTDLLKKSVFSLHTDLDQKTLQNLCAGWALAAYRFSAYKKRVSVYPKLALPKTVDAKRTQAFIESICATRTLINTPACHMGSSQLVKAAQHIAKPFKANVSVVRGDKLEKGFPLIHAVGAAAEQDPCLIDLRWGNAKNPQVTLIGKGVTFDTGGLNIKPESGMLLMKKDMGGAAHVLGLAHLIMTLKLPVRLRVLIPVAENSISDESMRPGDILRSRKGLSVEVTHTDAEGRLILADALDLAVEDKPDLIVDFATLTGAARVALGTDIPALFATRDETARDLQATALAVHDPLWRLPLWADYQRDMDSPVADMRNSGAGMAGAITAALFLNRFVPDYTDWVHIDTYAWENVGRPGRAAGGCDLGLRAVFAYLEQRYA